MSDHKIIQEVRMESEVAVAALAGSLDVSLQKNLKNELERLAQEQADIVLDMSGVVFIDSSCLGALVAMAKVLRGRDGDIKLSLLSEDVLSIFQITRLDRVFGIYDSVEEAIAAYY